MSRSPQCSHPPAPTFDGGPCLRVGANGDMVWLDISSQSGAIVGNIFSRVGGVNSAIGTLFSRPGNASYTATLRAVGEDITALLDGVVLTTGKDPGHAGTGVGLVAFASNDNACTHLSARKYPPVVLYGDNPDGGGTRWQRADQMGAS